MGFWKFIADLLTFQVPEQSQPFELLETVEDYSGGRQQKTNVSEGSELSWSQTSLPSSRPSVKAGLLNDQTPSETQSQTSKKQDQESSSTKPQSPDQPKTGSEDAPNYPSSGYRLHRPLKRPQKIGAPTTIDVVQKVENILRQKQKTAQESNTSGQNKSGNTEQKPPVTDKPASSPSRRQHRGHRKNKKNQTEAKYNTNQSTNETSASEKSQPATSQPDQNHTPVLPDLEANLLYIGEAFYWPKDTGLIFREFMVSTEPPLKAVAIYLEGLADPSRIHQGILQPLMLLSGLSDLQMDAPLMPIIKQRLTTNAAIETKNNLQEIVEEISAGATVVFFQGIPEALIVETSGWPRRSVEKAVSERVIRGPQEAFNEDLATSVSMIRRLLRDPRLIKEDLTVGHRARNQCALIYLQDLANPRLVQEIKRRIQSLEVDAVLSSGALEQLIEDNTWGLYPLSMATERTDRTVSALLEGKVVVFLEGDPFALVYPSTAWSLMQTAEDHAQRDLAATTLRGIRWLSALILVFLPGFYVAVTGYHPEMIPTDLLLSIAANRNRVPFPSVIEILIMEFSFELIREAGIRIPGVIGPTLGIVGAIILGQAAVAAALVNPVVIVLVAITGISSFAIPAYSLAVALRIYRFAYIILGATLGLFGLALGFGTHLVILASLKSMGVPYLAPLGPLTFANKDLFAQGFIWKQERRPDYLGVKDPYRQAPIARKWILSPDKGGNKK